MNEELMPRPLTLGILGSELFSHVRLVTFLSFTPPDCESAKVGSLSNPAQAWLSEGKNNGCWKSQSPGWPLSCQLTLALHASECA